MSTEIAQFGNIDASEDLMRRCTPNFIAELAARVNEPALVLEKYGIEPLELKFLRDIPAFRTAYREAAAFWKSDANTKERIAVKAAIMVEDSLFDIFDIVKNADSNLAARLDAFKQLKEIAQVDSKAVAAGMAAGGTGQRISINIKLGGSVVASRETEVVGGLTIEEGDENG